VAAVGTFARMQHVVIDPPAAVLAERARLGLDVFDEVWNGEYHMVPSPTNEHQRMELMLAMAIHPVADDAGLEVRCELNLLPADAVGFEDFRVPDLVVFHPSVGAEEGVRGPASLVVEIRSPGDESFEKLPFFDRIGVGEVLIIDRDTKAVRRWARVAGDPLVEVAPAADGQHRLACLPLALRTEDEILVVDAAGTEHRI
jgi:Uma2 family endonuclease